MLPSVWDGAAVALLWAVTRAAREGGFVRLEGWCPRNVPTWDERKFVPRGKLETLYNKIVEVVVNNYKME